MTHLGRFLRILALMLIPFISCGDWLSYDDPCEGVNCDDRNPCTRDHCVGGECEAAHCVHDPVKDGTNCSIRGASGVCMGGVCDLCVGVVCEDDGNPCTRDVCDPNTGRCGVPADNGTVCEYKGLFPGFCASGFCAKSLCEDGVCDDGNECTDDVCDSVARRCTYTPVEDHTSCNFDGLAGLCIDGVCREDLCDGVDCDDQNACTDDLCNGADGSCEHTPIDCTSDSNDCTTDTCDPAIGCEYTPVPNGTPCTVGTCQAGVCTWPDIDLPEGFAAFVFYDGILGPDGIVVVSDETLNVVNEFGPDGPFVLSAPRGGTYSTDDALSTIGPPLVSPDDLEAGAGEQLFIADGQANTVFTLPQSGGEPIAFVTPATTGFEQFNPFGVEVVPPTFDGPSVDPGDLIVADNAYGTDRVLWAVSEQTGLATVLAQGAVFEGGPLRAEFGPDGTLYVFENYAPGSDLSRIVTVASDGTVIPFVEEIPARGGLAVHPQNGDVYFRCGIGELCRVVYGTTTSEQFASNVGSFQSLEFSQSGLSLFVGATERDQVIEIRGDEQAWGVP